MNEIKSIVLISKKTSSSKKVFDSLIGYNRNWIMEDEDVFLKLKELNPDLVVVFHWSKIISKKIYNEFKCLCFHTGNLPEDRGGAPIQNQILNGKKHSRVNLIELTDPIDSGDVYCSKEISLQGSLNDIWITITETSIILIKKYLSTKPDPIPQKGKVTNYRRKTNNNLIIDNIESIHNQIRMLDGDGYPRTYLEKDGFIFEFSNSQFKNNEIISTVKIFKK